MTRQEQIEKEAYSRYPLNPRASNPNKSRPGFIKGAKWADENPKEGLVSLEEVCEWISDNYLPSEAIVNDLKKYFKR